MSNVLNRIIHTSIYLLVFLIPLFFLPFSSSPLEYNKQFLIFFFVSLAFFAWMAKQAFCEKEIRIRYSFLDIFVLGFLLVAILSTVFSVDKSSSLYGFYGRFNGGLINLLSLGLLYFLITNIGASRAGAEQSREQIQGGIAPIPVEVSPQLNINILLKLFFWSVGVVVLMSYFSVFGIWARIWHLVRLPEIMTLSIFNPTAASLEGLSIFLAVAIVFLAGKMLISQKSNKSLITDCLLLFAVLLLLVMIDFMAAWVVLLTALTLMVGFSVWKRIFRENVNRLLVPIFLIIVAAVCIPWQAQKALIDLPEEQILNQSTSWEISLKTAIDNPKTGFLGSGPGTFHYDFAKEKTQAFNQTRLWNIRFDRAGSHLAEILGTMGFLGMLSYLSIIGLFLLMSWLSKPNIKQQLLWLTAFIALVVGQFVYYQNSALGFFFWLILGLSVVCWQKPMKEKAVSFKNFPELSLVFSTIIIVLGIAVLALYFSAGRFYMADINFAKAQRMEWGPERTETLENAVRLNSALPQYRMLLARSYMNEALTEMQKPAGEQDVARASVKIAQAIDQGKIATALGPNLVSAWETLGMIYREIRAVASGAAEWGVKAFETAISLEPTNPVIYTELGKLYVEIAKPEKAGESFDKALELKPDYVDALIRKATLLEEEGKRIEAIAMMEKAAADYPVVEIVFQLGRLYFNNGQIDEAIVQFKKITRTVPDHSNAHYSLGLAYIAKGEIQAAIQEFEKVLELNPGNQDVIQKLKQLKQ